MSRGQKRILFTEQFYWPEGWGGAQLPRDITIHLASHGWAVEVLCGADQYATIDGDAGEDPRPSGVYIRRIRKLFGGDIHRLKLVRQLWFYTAALPLLLVRSSPNVFVVQTNPPLIVPLVALVARLRRRPYVIIAQDLYPEVVFAYGMMQSRSLMGRLLTRLFRWAYRGAARVVSLGSTMSRRLVEKGVSASRIEEISNWSTGDSAVIRGEENQLRADWGLRGRFVIVYSGNIGAAHDVETVLRALELLRAEGAKVTVVFIGKGTRLGRARELANELGLGDDVVQFRPLVAGALLPHTLGLADVALVTLLPNFEGLVVPSKVMGLLARGIPTIYVGPDGDISQFLQRSGGGFSIAPADAPGLASLIRELALNPSTLESVGVAGRRYYDKHLAKSIALQRYAVLLEREIERSSQAAA